MLNWRCWLGHDWKPIQYENYWDISYGRNEPSYQIIYVCKNCREVKNKSFYGRGFLTKHTWSKIQDE